MTIQINQELLSLLPQGLQGSQPVLQLQDWDWDRIRIRIRIHKKPES